MRTTIQLDDEVFKAFKRRAVDRGTSLAQEIEGALRADLAARAEVASFEPYQVLTFEGVAPMPGVDLNSNSSLLDTLEGTE